MEEKEETSKAKPEEILAGASPAPTSPTSKPEEKPVEAKEETSKAKPEEILAGTSSSPTSPTSKPEEELGGAPPAPTWPFSKAKPGKSGGSTPKSSRSAASSS